MTLEELRAAVDEDRLVLPPVARRAHVRAALHARARSPSRPGSSSSFLTASRRALGLPVPDPDGGVFGETDLEAAARHAAPARPASPTRRRSRSRACSARAWPATPRRPARCRAARSSSRASTSYELAHRYRAVAEQLMPLAGPWLEHVFALHLRQVLRRTRVTQEQRRTGRLDGTQEAAVAFADLVGFTGLGETVPLEELGGRRRRLARLAAERSSRPCASSSRSATR